MSKIEKRPATENDILVINDRHGFDENPNLDPPILHDVLVDGHPAKAGVGSFGMYSTNSIII